MKQIIFILSILMLIISNSCTKYDNYEFYDYDNPPEKTFTDTRDGHTYKYIKIGNQYWMAENLAYKPSSGNYWAYDNDENNVATYGYLYDWETAYNVCPAGWHLPTDAEWQELIDYLGGDNIAGGKMKEIGTKHWRSPNTGANNRSGFSARPGGFRDNDDGTFYELGTNGNWWSDTNHYHTLDYGRVAVYDNYDESFGFSVRCVRD